LPIIINFIFPLNLSVFKADLQNNWETPYTWLYVFNPIVYKNSAVGSRNGKNSRSEVGEFGDMCGGSPARGPVWASLLKDFIGGKLWNFYHFRTVADSFI
jgi:hypothetical protein